MVVFDIFNGWTIEEILRVNELALMAALVLIAVFAVGEASEPARAIETNLSFPKGKGGSRPQAARMAQHGHSRR